MKKKGRGGGKKRQATEELRSDVYLDGGSAAHEAQIVEFYEAFAEHVFGRGTSGGETDGCQCGAVNVEVGERAGMNVDGLLLSKTPRIVHGDSAGWVAGHQILLTAT